MQPHRTRRRAHAAGRSVNTAAGALAGLQVLDFTIVMAGPMCTRMLADAGADVVKVEPPEGDVARQRAPLRAGSSTYYGSLNCGKRSVVLDLAQDEGRRIARELASQCDVLVENFRPGVMQRLGLDYATLAEANPRLVYASISGFGQTGPRAAEPAYAPVIHAASGYELANASYQLDASRPLNNGVFLADVLGASYAFGAIQLALYERERSGRGQHIDLALLDSVLGMLVYEVLAAQFPPERRRQLYEPVRAADGWVMVAAVTARNQEALFDVIGHSEARQDPRFATLAAKEEHWSELLELIEGWTRRRTGEECERMMAAAGVPCSRYRSVAEAMADPQLAHRGFFAELGEGEGRFRCANQPYRLSRTPTHARARLAALGEHGAEVLQEKLGLDAAQIERLRAARVLG
ncbi:MAG: CoA transferase [Ideonella sp.]|nr:CoA transferase [Ideonella sp.]MCC7459022.1 CoA transferase [Nitrospira sp.]